MCVYCDPDNYNYWDGEAAGRLYQCYETRDLIHGLIDRIEERLKHPYDTKPRTHNGEPDWEASVAGLKSMAKGFRLLLEEMDGKDTFTPYLE